MATSGDQPKKTASMTANHSDNLASQIDSRRIELLFRHAKVSCAGNNVAALLALLILLPQISAALLVPWVLAIAACMAQRCRLAALFGKRNRYSSPIAWHQCFDRNVAINGGLWGALGALAGSTTSLELSAWFSMLVGAMLAGSAIAYSASRWTFWYYAIPAVSPLVASLALAGTADHWLLATSLSCWSLLIWSFTRQFGQHYRKSWRYEFENIALLQELHWQQERARQLKDELQLKSSLIEQLRQRNSFEHC